MSNLCEAKSKLSVSVRSLSALQRSLTRLYSQSDYLAELLRTITVGQPSV